MYEYLNQKTILITGATGSFGKKCLLRILTQSKPRKVVVFSRDELKQSEMKTVFNQENYPNVKISYYLGDIRDEQRLHRAFNGVDYVIHAAALKQVPAAEYNPDEAIKTNVIGAMNIVNAAIDQKVKKVIALSTDKAVNPINLYGATKLCSEKMFVAGNTYSGDSGTIFSVTRYGNVLGSRGSVIPIFAEKRKEGVLPITDSRMTRFWMTLDQSVDLVLNSLEVMNGGEIFIPKIPSMNVLDLAKAIAPNCEIKITGIRPGEKLHESLLSKGEVRNTIKTDSCYVILPEHFKRVRDLWKNCEKLPEDFVYSSNANDSWLNEDDLRELVKEFINVEEVEVSA